MQCSPCFLTNPPPPPSATPQPWIFFQLPPELPLRLPHLRYLDLSYNQLEHLPCSFGLLFHLQTLLVQHNRLRSLPATFTRLVKLEKVPRSWGSGVVWMDGKTLSHDWSSWRRCLDHGGVGWFGWMGKLCHTIGQAGEGASIMGEWGGLDGWENFVTRLVKLEKVPRSWGSGVVWMDGKTLSHDWSSWRCVRHWEWGGWKGKLGHTIGRAAGVSVGVGLDGRENFVTRLVELEKVHQSWGWGGGLDGRENFVTRLVELEKVHQSWGCGGVDGRKNFVTRLVELEKLHQSLVEGGGGGGGGGWTEGKTLSNDWWSWRRYSSHGWAGAEGKTLDKTISLGSLCPCLYTCKKMVYTC